MDELSRTEQRHEEPAQQHGNRHVFLDDELHVRRFTSRATKLFKLIPGDVGRPAHRHRQRPGLPRDGRRRAGGAADAGFSRKTDHHPGRALVHGAHHALPHLENLIDGVVITFTDITAAKKLEAELRTTETVRSLLERSSPRSSRKIGACAELFRRGN